MSKNDTNVKLKTTSKYKRNVPLTPAQVMKKMRGFLKGIDTTIEREPDREL